MLQQHVLKQYRLRWLNSLNEVWNIVIIYFCFFVYTIIFEKNQKPKKKLFMGCFCVFVFVDGFIILMVVDFVCFQVFWIDLWLSLRVYHRNETEQFHIDNIYLFVFDWLRLVSCTTFTYRPTAGKLETSRFIVWWGVCASEIKLFLFSVWT